MQAATGSLEQTYVWLLEPENPAVRYRCLVDLIGKGADDPEVRAALKMNMESGPVAKILAGQDLGGYWGKPEDFYIRSKYKGTVWNLILLSELGADPQDERVQKAADFIIEWSQDRQSGGFAYATSAGGGGDREKTIPCLTGNMLWALLRFGRLDDERVQRGIEWICSYQRFDDGAQKAPAGWPFERYPQCWGKHTCLMGVVKALKALAEIPAGLRTPPVQTTIENAAEFLLRHHIYRSSHDLSRVSLPEWQLLGFPRFWDSDALEILEILTRLGIHDERMGEAIDLVRSKQDENGRWKLESSWNGRMLARIEQEGKTSKWITLKALKVLSDYDGGQYLC